MRNLILLLLGLLVLSGCTGGSVSSPPAGPADHSSKTTPKKPDSSTPKTDTSAGQPPSKQEETGSQSLQALLQEVEITEMAPEGRYPIWYLKAKRLAAQIAQEGASGKLYDVQGILYKCGVSALEFQAKNAQADSKTGRVIAWGGVKARSKTNGAELAADQMVWASQKNQITADGNVRFRWREVEIKHRHLVADTVLSRISGH